MKFALEIIQSGKGGKVLCRDTADEISPKRATAKAQQLLELWRHRGADVVRVLNQQGEELYRFSA